MLSIESVLDIVVYIDLVNYLVRVFLQSSCENYYFIILGHQFNEMDATWTHQKEAVLSIFDIVYEGLVQIQNKSIFICDVATLERRQEWWRHFWQVLEIIWKNSRL